jgi:hypothetical protein
MLDLTSAYAINSKDENILAHRAKLQMKMGKCNEAVADFENLKR